MKLLLLTPEEKETIELRRDDTSHYRSYGDPSIYMLPPCIILGEDGNYDAKVEIPKEFTLTEAIETNDYCSYIPVKEMDEIHNIQKSLGIKPFDTGLFTSLKGNTNRYNTELRTIRIKNLELVELDKHTAKTIRRRPLKRF